MLTSPFGYQVIVTLHSIISIVTVVVSLCLSLLHAMCLCLCLCGVLCGVRLLVPFECVSLYWFVEN